MPNDKPNVLFIPNDDLRPQLGGYGHRQMVTPMSTVDYIMWKFW